MTAQPLSATHRYFPPGIRQYYIVDTIANPAAPTRLELDAGTDITDEVVDGSVNGFEINPATIDVGDAGSSFTGKIGGRSTVDVSSFGIYLSEDTSDARALFAKGARKFVVIFPEGDHAPTTGADANTYTMDVFPVEVLAAPIDPNTTSAGQCKLTFAVTDEPALNVPVPAAA